MITNNSGIEFIKQHEKLKLQVYQDTSGNDTIGYGHLITAGEDVLRGGITEPQAEQLLRNDIHSAEFIVNKIIKVPLTQDQFNALVSYAFNIGGGNFQDGDLQKLINSNAGEDAIRKHWTTHWITSNGIFTQGLLNRREDEADLFFSPVYYHVKNNFLPIMVILAVMILIIYLLK